MSQTERLLFLAPALGADYTAAAITLGSEPPITATEILARREEYKPRMDVFLKEITETQRRIEAAYFNELFKVLGVREIGAQRARFLRRRGEYVVYSHRSPRGKARYVWMPKP